MSINVLFVIGGDGTLRGARRIARVIAERGEKIAVVGVPKTIDNDIMFIDQSFGFQTAVAEATRAVRAAHAEAEASPNGIGLLKLMGRHSGFLACYAALANVLRRRLETRRHAVIVAAEGAGQHLLTGRCATDALGNVKLQEHPGLREAAAGRILCSHRHGVQSQVHRPELRNSKRARQSIR